MDWVSACREALKGKVVSRYSAYKGKKIKRWIQVLAQGTENCSVSVEQWIEGVWASCGSDPFMEDFLSNDWSIEDEAKSDCEIVQTLLKQYFPMVEFSDFEVRRLTQILQPAIGILREDKP